MLNLKNSNSKTKDISWIYFKIPNRMLKRIRRAKRGLRVEVIEAQAKSLLSGFIISYYLNQWSWSEQKKEVKDQELIFAQQLASFWRKKYKEEKKLQEKRLASLKEKKENAVKTAFKVSKLNKKHKKQKEKIQKQTKETLKEKSEFSGASTLKTTLKCSLCSGNSVIYDAYGDAYPCPKCSQHIETGPLKRVSYKTLPELGKRKVKF